eukprot:21081-Eustigmatos_ZCMA.PRE.1
MRAVQDDFQLLPATLQKLKEADPGTICELLTDDEGNSLAAVCCPSACQTILALPTPHQHPVPSLWCMQLAAPLCRKMSFTDACHAKNELDFRYLSMNALDGDEHIVVVALGVLRGERKELRK